MSLLREEEYRALSSVTLFGSVADLGGDLRSSYHRLVKGKHTVTTINIDPESRPDIRANLEEPLPIAEGVFENALLINALEHIYRYRELLSECRRILKTGGVLVVIVPYLFPYHPSPHDYHRFSHPALERALEEAGFTVTSVVALGSGVFAAQWLMLERLLPSRIQRMISFISYPIVRGADYCLKAIARILRKRYDPADYALGFMVTAEAR